MTTADSPSKAQRPCSCDVQGPHYPCSIADFAEAEAKRICRALGVPYTPDTDPQDDDMEGGVTAALIEQEAEARPKPSEGFVEKVRSYIQEQAGVTLSRSLLREALIPEGADDLVGGVAAALIEQQARALTAREHLDAAREAAHPLPKGSTIPAHMLFWVNSGDGEWDLVPYGPVADFDTSPFPAAEYRTLEPVPRPDLTVPRRSRRTCSCGSPMRGRGGAPPMRSPSRDTARPVLSRDPLDQVPGRRRRAPADRGRGP